MTRLNPLDASWLYTESRETPMHVGSLMVFELPRGHRGAGQAGAAPSRDHELQRRIERHHVRQGDRTPGEGNS
ncbi:MAG: hypothetical protein HC788_10740 [Sphingopyxis sp.]|nr:hypothetical protein [Sphingopyxis sp.]